MIIYHDCAASFREDGFDGAPNGWAFSGRRCRRVWIALSVLLFLPAKIAAIWPLRWNAMLGGHAHGWPEWACASSAANAPTNHAGQPALIQPTPGTTGVCRRGVAAGAHPTHVQHHERSDASACHQRRSNPRSAPRAFACAGLRRARLNARPAPRAFAPRSIRLIGWYCLHCRASNPKSRAEVESRSARIPPNGLAFSCRERAG